VRQGLAFRSDVELDGDVLGAQISDSYKEFMSGTYCKMSRRHYRPIGADPEEREDGTHRNVNETIDSSVFDRWRDVPQYRPPKLAPCQTGPNAGASALYIVCG
jgi:hypothetical protein